MIPNLTGSGKGRPLCRKPLEILNYVPPRRRKTGIDFDGEMLYNNLRVETEKQKWIN